MGTTLATLQPPPGARKRRKRVGRGIGSRRGKTSTRGVKGQLARHNEMPDHFEGGQNPLQRRVPKRGFINVHREEYHGVNVGLLEGKFAAGEEVSLETLRAKRLIPKRVKQVKLLGTGELKTALTVKIAKVSESARQKVEAAGGSIQAAAEAAAEG